VVLPVMSSGLMTDALGYFARFVPVTFCQLFLQGRHQDRCGYPHRLPVNDRIEIFSLKNRII
jgi:hypothetical protein